MDNNLIINSIQEILNKNFTSKARRTINVYPERLNFCCFYCGDSHQNEHKKRGNLYLDKFIYICFNCDKKIGLQKLLTENGIDVSSEIKWELSNLSIKHKNREEDIGELRLDKLLKLSSIEEFFNNEPNSRISDFKPIQRGSKQHRYLLDRKIDDNKQKDIYQAKYWNTKHTWSDDVIVFLNRRKEDVLGMQIRNIKKDNRFFMIINYQNLHNMISSDIQIEEDKMQIYNKLSYFYNILNVDFGDDITIFEGFLDSLFLPNSIGVVGTNTDTSILENEHLNIRYFFDNDPAGNKKTLEKLLQKKTVFLWEKLFDDIIKNKMPADPYKFKKKISGIKDLNNLNEIVDDAYNKLKLDNFFSKDVLDVIWIPNKKTKYEK